MHRPSLPLWLVRAALALLIPFAAADSRDDIGLTAIQATHPDLPTGAGVALLIGDFTSKNTNNAWAVEPTGELTGKSIRYLPARARPSRFSPHATGVGTIIAGRTTGMLPALDAITSVHSEYYCSNVLNVRTGIAPTKPNWDLEVHTWNWADEEYSLELIRRMDWRVDRQGVTVVEALTNGRDTKLPYVFTSGYNVITVGVAAGTHSSGATTIEGTGRTKPDIVAPTQYTSGATPTVAACAGLLIAEAKRTAPLALAKDPRVVKALLLAGADKTPISSWVHTPTQPLDEHYGAGQVNIAASYSVLVGGRQPPAHTWLPYSGWDRGTSGTSRYFFAVPAGQPLRFSAILTWHREIAPDPSWTAFSSALANLNLRLSAATPEHAVGQPLAESRSRVDNVEHIYLPALPEGYYVLEVTGEAGVAYGLAWWGATDPHPVAPSAPAKQPEPELFHQLTTGASAEVIRALAGPPQTVKPFRHKTVKGEIWTYTHRRHLHDRAVPTGYRESTDTDPKAGSSRKVGEPILGLETTYLDETIDLLIVDGHVAEIMRQHRVAREVR